MKRTLYLALLLFCIVSAQAQVGAPWLLGGNGNVNGFPPTQIIGPNTPFPLRVVTAAIERMHINQNVTNNINLQGATTRNGFVGIGEVAGFYPQNGGPGAYSLLHLNGFNFLGAPQTGGYRNWMKYGITSTHNQDLAFWGQRSTGGNDITDVVLGWADNSGSGFPGPDNLVFDFTAGTGSANNDLSGDAPNGREVMRMKATGEVGIGPRFNNTWQPQSTLHQHQENNASSWMQITNQFLTTGTPIQTAPTSIGPNNGLRWGILGDATQIRNGNAFIYNQENRHLIFSTNNPTPTNINNTLERMRITSLSAPTFITATGGYGVNNPGGNPFTTATRVSISALPFTPLTSPLSLVHIGFNTNSTLDGWRPWMEIGTFTSFRNPFLGGPGINLYTGLNLNPSTLGGSDAVVGWGHNPSTATNGTTGNRLRFIFTSTAGGGFLSGSPNGLEAGHFWSDGNNTRLGVGDFFAGTDPLNTLEIKTSASSPYFGSLNGSSGLKFRNMTSSNTPTANPGLGVLGLDNQGNVIYVNGGSSNCCLGNNCSSLLNPLSGSWEIPLNTNNFYFVGNGGPGQDRVGIGFNGCTPNPGARLHVMQNSGTANDISTLTDNTCVDGVALKARSGGSASGVQTKVAGWFEATPAIGVQQVAIYVPQGQGLVNIGYPTPSSVGTGGGLLNVNGTGAFNGDVIPAIDCNASERCGNPSNRWFEVWSCNGAIQTSDERLKENIKPLAYGIETIKKLNPVTYNWKGNASYGDKIGFVAQELKMVIKEVVREGDDNNKTLGVNYAELVPVLVKAIQDQQKTIESQQKQFDELKALVQSLAGNTSSDQNKTISGVPVTLSDKNVVILNQNVPNPFAENTVISYNITEDFGKAQILFSTSDGKILKAVDITSKGEGTLNVFANDLSSGVYIYSLVIDGKIIDTKKMVKQN